MVIEPPSWVKLASVVVLAAALAGCGDDGPDIAVPAPPQPVETTPIETTSIGNTTVATSSVEAPSVETAEEVDDATVTTEGSVAVTQPNDTGSPAGPPGDAAAGEAAFIATGCNACHTTNGARLAGPTLQGVAGNDVLLSDGSTRLADTAYLTESIKFPTAAVVDGFQGLMPDYGLDDATIADLVAYIETL